MVKAAAAIFDDIEGIAGRDSWMHARDARAKIIVAIAFLVTLVSFESHSVSDLLPLALIAVSWATLGSVSLRWLLRRLMIPVVAALNFLGEAMRLAFDPKSRESAKPQA